MKRNRLTLTAVCMLACACVLPAQGADSLQQTLKGMWQGKEITLRTPDPASTISFDSNAVPIGDRKPGIWTDDSRFQVADVQVAAVRFESRDGGMISIPNKANSQISQPTET